MNEHLDVLRYWLPGWEFKMYGEFIGFTNDDGDPHCTTHELSADHLCAELRRKYLEREEVLYVETVVGPGEAKVRTLTGPLTKQPSPSIADTELLATIEAGARLMEALEG